MLYVLENSQIVSSTAAAIHINKNALWSFEILFEIPSCNNFGQFNRFTVVEELKKIYWDHDTCCPFIYFGSKIIFAIIKGTIFVPQNICELNELIPTATVMTITMTITIVTRTCNYVVNLLLHTYRGLFLSIFSNNIYIYTGTLTSIVTH